MNQPTWDDLKERIERICGAAREVFYGMSVYEWVRECRKSRGELERVFVLIVFGDLLGVPILPPYHVLRLLPYVVPQVEGWKRSMLRERDLTDLFDQDIG
ncbi:MAG: hypothetical protein KGY78_05965 [Anaerolineae bacterium]|nr:hypothetical protein [Anaerolineae bacterium]